MLKWDAAGKENTHSVGSLDRWRLKETPADGGCGRESRAMSGVDKELVDSWDVGADVGKVYITKQADWTLISVWSPFYQASIFALEKLPFIVMCHFSFKRLLDAII